MTSFAETTCSSDGSPQIYSKEKEKIFPNKQFYFEAVDAIHKQMI